jgi:hypothetical protein
MEIPSEEMLESMRPKHIDFEALRILVNRMDDAEDGPALLEEVAGRPLDELMDQALKASISITQAKEDPKNSVMMLMGLGNLIDFVDYFRAAWLAGLAEGLEETRGIEIPVGWHIDPSLFWDLDGKSVQYVTDQRIIRVIMHNTDEEGEKTHPFVAMASAWMDGISVGLQFDQVKEELIK